MLYNVLLQSIILAYLKYFFNYVKEVIGDVGCPKSIGGG